MFLKHALSLVLRGHRGDLVDPSQLKIIHLFLPLFSFDFSEKPVSILTLGILALALGYISVHISF